jgi:outer membrane receptor protein involved in Fe transport
MMASMEVADGVKLTVFERYRGPMDWFPTFVGTGAPQYVIQGAPANIPGRFYTNVNVAFETGPAEFFFNVQNLFNTAPAPYANFTSGLPGNNGVAPGDDPIGRYFVTGVRLKF